MQVPNLAMYVKKKKKAVSQSRGMFPMAYISRVRLWGLIILCGIREAS